MAPPIIDMIRKDDPNSVRSPSPSTPSTNIVGNMIDMKKLVSHIVATAIAPPAIVGHAYPGGASSDKIAACLKKHGVLYAREVWPTGSFSFDGLIKKCEGLLKFQQSFTVLI